MKSITFDYFLYFFAKLFQIEWTLGTEGLVLGYWNITLWLAVCNEFWRELKRQYSITMLKRGKFFYCIFQDSMGQRGILLWNRPMYLPDPELWYFVSLVHILWLHKLCIFILGNQHLQALGFIGSKRSVSYSYTSKYMALSNITKVDIFT